MVTVKFRKLRDGARAPTRASAHAAGWDLYTVGTIDLLLGPGNRRIASTGIAIELPSGYEAQVRPRSGLAQRHGVTVLNSPGTIDADYRGEVKVLLVNLGSEIVTLSPGDRIAQLVVAPVATVCFEEVEELSDTSRGTGGFGSTGR